MFDTIRISVDHLDEGFIERLREQYPHSNLEIKVGETGENGGLTEAQFWALIDLPDWSKAGDDEAVIRPLVEVLANSPVRHIYEFQDFLSEKLHLLDTQAHAENTGENAWQGEERPFSVDEFLYARCCVVANGRKAFETALKNPSKMPKDLSFEALLRVARQSFLKKTGKPFRYVPAFNMETFANHQGWQTG